MSSAEGSPSSSLSLTFADFLQQTPPDVDVRIPDLAEYRDNFWFLRTPVLHMHCPTTTCNGIRAFACEFGDKKIRTQSTDEFLYYICRNCRTYLKTFAIRVSQESSGSAPGRARKLGEINPFGPPVPARVITLIGGDRELFLKGRTAENRGLGIGAFAYYRRVVESQKGRIIEEIGKVTQRLGAPEGKLKLFSEAATETQFKAAIDKIKDVIPESIMVDGHNPLTLLHTALSEGLHAKTDEECLRLATSIRVLLTELAERISEVLKDHAELKDALSRLLNREAK